MKMKINMAEVMKCGAEECTYSPAIKRHKKIPPSQ